MLEGRKDISHVCISFSKKHAPPPQPPFNITEAITNTFKGSGVDHHEALGAGRVITETKKVEGHIFVLAVHIVTILIVDLIE